MTDFPPDFAIHHRGQIYKPLRVRPYEKLDGTSTTVIDWQSTCPDCGKSFVATTRLSWTGEVNRRCQECKAPGRRVGKLPRAATASSPPDSGDAPA